MTTTSKSTLRLSSLFLSQSRGHADPFEDAQQNTGIVADFPTRRRSLISISSFLIVTGIRSASWADDGAQDMTSAMFNSDGSLKDGVESEAKFQNVQFTWDASSSSLDSYIINVDGSDTTAAPKSASDLSVRVSYQLPVKWRGPSGSNDKNLYQDMTVQKDDGEITKALTRITVYQSPGLVEENRLEKAASFGIAKSLNVIPDLSPLQSADFVGGRTRSLGGEKDGKVFEFDLAVAPKSCESDSKDNLRLGFCPFDTIYLLSATVVKQRLYVFALECSKDQWKMNSSDLRKVRSSFLVSP